MSAVGRCRMEQYAPYAVMHGTQRMGGALPEASGTAGSGNLPVWFLLSQTVQGPTNTPPHPPPTPAQRLDLRVLFSWEMRMGRAAQLYGEIPEQTPWLLTEQLTFSPFGPSLPGPPLVPGSPLRPCREWA